VFSKLQNIEQLPNTELLQNVIKMKKILIVLLFIAVLFIGGCVGENNNTEVVSEEEIDLCNEINNPTATVFCEENHANCYITIAGDSRVDYKVVEYGFWGNMALITEAGVRTELNSNNQDSVEIIPRYKDKHCDNKRIVVPRGQFSGDPGEIYVPEGYR
jgi:hypothetical protein